MLRNPVDHTARQAHTKALAAAEPGELSVTTSRPAGGTHVLDKLAAAGIGHPAVAERGITGCG